jgi:hypothetical protein
MKTFYGIILLALGSAVWLVYWLLSRVTPDAAHWISVYDTQARTPMFTGFLTLGSFLLTLQTAIIARLKEGYDSDDHARKVEQLRAKGKKVRYYSSLERVGLVISTNVILALVTAVLQITFGFALKVWSTSLCVGFGFVTIVLVIYLSIQLVMAHHQWFKKIEAEKSSKQS